jgi:hypothetical protein
MLGLNPAKSNARFLIATLYLFIAVGGWMVIMAKPTSALVLTLLVCVWGLTGGVQRLKGMVFSAFTALVLLVASAYAFAGGIVELLHQYSQGLYVAQLMLGNSWASAVEIVWRGQFPGTFKNFAVLGAMAVLSYLALTVSRRRYGVLACLLCMVVLSFLLYLLPHLNPLMEQGVRPRYPVVGFYGVIVGSLVYFCLRYFSEARNRPGEAGHRPWILIAILFVFPYSFAVGSGLSYWRVLLHASVFYLCALVLMSLVINVRSNLSRQASELGALGALLLLFLFASLSAATNQPFRQPGALASATPDSHEIARIPPVLRLQAESWEYLQRVDYLLKSEGFVVGDPILDLTGHSPGVVFAVGGQHLGAAWNLGRHAGSAERLVYELGSNAKSDLSRAWLLIAPGGRRSISADILSRFGLDLEADYQYVGSVSLPPGFGRDRRHTAPEQHRLYKAKKHVTAFGYHSEKKRKG